MDYQNKTWDEEDKEFYPKRKVNNKASWKIHHIIGSFYSEKMERTVEYESMGEYIFYSLLELDKAVQRYYVQPIFIEIPCLDKYGVKKVWNHVSDVLVFREGISPQLLQIKDKPSEALNDGKNKIINNACLNYAKNRNWSYDVIYPKQLSENVLSNIKFLIGFRKVRKEYGQLTSKLILKLSQLKKSTIIDLSKVFEPDINSLYVLPIIYHIIAKGNFIVNVNLPISQFSEVEVALDNKSFNQYFNVGGIISEI
ncbi:hypothetical protein [Clostridium tagluense]|uniref:Uncharacterized protein n=1 Tax=Clostridium tagluense TaxID=360422 RepID=A0A401UP60_9CLOT|nr:hypothetical protein [Clostridium tagluense]GCD11316.1 hypothetical protein Ctaglu_29390 [Clostridium tagluense]